MNKLKEARPVVFLTCFMLGIASFLIFFFASALIIIDSDSIDKISRLSKSAGNNALATVHTATDDEPGDMLSVGQVSKSRSEVYEEERRALFMADNSSQYAASRGESNRSEENIASRTGTDQAAPVTAEQTDPAASPAAKPAPVPVKAAVKPVAAKPPAAAPKAAPAKAASGHEYDLDLLARLITAEAQGEPYEAKVAVGAVVMNRVKSSDWPNTIKGVIYQYIGGYYQFTPVENGWINKPAEPGSIAAAKEALNGADPTNGAQFYYDDTVTNPWILAKPVSAQYGHMIFAY